MARDALREAEGASQHVLADLQADNRKRRGGASDWAGPSAAAKERPASKPANPTNDEDNRPRVLVDPAALTLSDWNGRIVRPTPAATTGKKQLHPQRALRPPDPNGAPPRQRSSYRAYTDLQKETLGLDLLRWVLQRHDQGIVDLRAQRNVGADAVDELRRFFEIKVYAGAEPDSVRLEPSETQLALEASDAFFLVVVSSLEGPNATPRVRIIDRPLERLTLSNRTVIEYNRIWKAGELVFDFRRDAQPPNDPATTSDEA